MKSLRSIRRGNLELLVKQHGGQSAFAQRIQKDKNQVYQWLLDPENPQSRNLSDRSARAIEAACDLPSSWLDHERLAVREQAETYSASQSARPDPEILAASLKLIRLAFQMLETEHNPEEDGLPTTLAYSYLLKHKQRAVTAENVVDFSRYLRKALQGDVDDRVAGAGRAGSGHR